jgi:NADP-dependent 3-hydroxy acid dehydrogenase YdfG
VAEPRHTRPDVTSEQNASAAIAWLESELADLDILVNNAGRFRGYAFDALTAGEQTREDVDGGRRDRTRP